MTDFRSGFVSIVGRPNAGKSTLINHLVKKKIAIISNKPQTTRDAIIGVLTTDDYQMIFIDTPGIHKPKHELGSRMNRVSYAHFHGVDVIYYLMDVSEAFGRGDLFVIERLKNTKLPIILVLNKIDQVGKDAVLERIVAVQEHLDFKEAVPISALHAENVDRLLEVTQDYLKDGVMYYPKDTVSAYPEQFIMAEIIREKILALTQEEIPHSVAVAIERIVKKKKAIVISAVIMVDRASQKGILIGKQGALIREVGKQARLELETILGQSVFLETYVRVETNWRNKHRLLNQLGYIETEHE